MQYRIGEFLNGSRSIGYRVVSAFENSSAQMKYEIEKHKNRAMSSHYSIGGTTPEKRIVVK